MKTSAATAPASSGLTSKISQPDLVRRCTLRSTTASAHGQRADEQPRAPPVTGAWSQGKTLCRSTVRSRMVTVGHLGRARDPGPRGEPLGAPAVGGTPVDQPVVHPARPALPELDRLGVHEVAAPLLGRRHVAAGVPPLAPRRTPRQLLAAGDDARLVRGPGAELGAARPDREVGVDRRPREQARRCRRRGPGARAGATGRAARARVAGQLGALAGAGVGVEDEARPRRRP